MKDVVLFNSHYTTERKAYLKSKGSFSLQNSGADTPIIIM
jgi:hypothetical protein